MIGYVFCPDRNSLPKYPHDWSAVFLPFGKACCRVLGLAPGLIQVNLHPEIADKEARYEARAQQVIDALEAHTGPPIEVFDLDCHGWDDGTMLVWAKARKRVTTLLAAKGAKNLHVFFAACSTGDNPNPRPGPGAKDGFAAKFYAELVAGGLTEATVDAHPDPGHAWLKTSVVRYCNPADPSAEEYVIENDRAARAKFFRWLRKGGCYTMQTLPLDEIRRRVAATQ